MTPWSLMHTVEVTPNEEVVFSDIYLPLNVQNKKRKQENILSQHNYNTLNVFMGCDVAIKTYTFIY